MIQCRKLCKYFVKKWWTTIHICMYIFFALLTCIKPLENLCFYSYGVTYLNWIRTAFSLITFIYQFYLISYLYRYILRMQWKQNTVFEFIAKVSVWFSIIRKVKYILYYILKCVVLHCIAYLMMIITIGIHFQIII